MNNAMLSTSTSTLKSRSLTQITHTTTTTNIDDDDDDFNNRYHPPSIIVPIAEAEYIIESLRPFPIHEIGCTPFVRMYAYEVERLSMQAHLSAQLCDGDEYIVDAILTHGKVSTIVKTLLAIEAWRSFVLVGADEGRIDGIDGIDGIDEGEDENDQRTTTTSTSTTTSSSSSSSSSSSTCTTKTSNSLAERLAENKSSLRCAFILHVETTLVSLLNLIMYRRENCAELDSDVMVALVDYCARQMSSLAVPLHENPMLQKQKQPKTVDEMMDEFQLRNNEQTTTTSGSTTSCTHTRTLEEIHDNLLQHQYKTAVVATSLARHLCEHLDSLPLSAQTRIMDTHDYLIMMVPLIEEPPWTRRRRKKCRRDGNGNENENENKKDNDDDEGEKTTEEGYEYIQVWEKLHDNNEWKEVSPSELLHVTQSEAQCWLALFHLTCGNKACRERYAWNVFRREQLLKLRKYLHEVMLDQIPVLMDVMRYMDELALMMDVPEVSTGQGAALLLQQVDTLREEIIDTAIKSVVVASSSVGASASDGGGEGESGKCGRDRHWDMLAKTQFAHIFSKCQDSTDEDLRLIAEIYNEDSLASALDASKDNGLVKRGEGLLSDPAMTAPLTIVQLKNGDKDLYNLTPIDNGQVVDTEYGAFRRTKLKLHPAGDDGDGDASHDHTSLLVPKALALKAIVSFEGFDGLKTLSFNASPFTDGSNAMQWVQIGTAEEKLILQLGFKMSKLQCIENECVYELRQAFLSQPALSS